MIIYSMVVAMVWLVAFAFRMALWLAMFGLLALVVGTAGLVALCYGVYCLVQREMSQ